MPLLLSVSARVTSVEKQARAVVKTTGLTTRRVCFAPSFGAAVYRNSLACQARGGSGLADTPSITIEKSTFKKSSKSPTYKVLLHNDGHNHRETVVKILLKVVENFHIEDAMRCMQEAHETGVAMVIACPQDQAEGYCESLRLNGLTSTIEV